MSWTKTDADELARLEAEFDTLGGRGVELAEQIDALRNRRGTEFTIDGLGPSGRVTATLVVRKSERARGREVEYDVFELLDDGEELVTVADPSVEFPTEAVLASLLTPRKRELARIMEEFSIVAGPDYDYDYVYEALYSPDPAPRYVAITHDETYNFFHVVDNLDVACASLADSLGEESGGQIHGVWDLDERQLIQVDHMAFAWPYSEPEGQPWGPEHDLRRARLALAAAARLFERRVRGVLAARIKAIFPDATTLHATGAYNEDGLLKLTPTSLTREDGTPVAEASAPTEAWDQLFLFEDDLVSELLDDLSESNGDDYLGNQEIDLT